MMTPASGRFRNPSTKAPASPLPRRRMKNSAQALGCRMCERPMTPKRTMARISTDLSISVNIEIATDDELAGVVLHHVRLQLFRRQTVVVIQNQQSWFRPLCNLRELLGRRVVLLRETPERSGRSSAGFGPRGKPGARVNFVNQDVTAAAGIDRCLSGIRIARDHDASVRSVEPVSITFHRMPGGKRRHRNVLILVDDARDYLVCIHFV